MSLSTYLRGWRRRRLNGWRLRRLLLRVQGVQRVFRHHDGRRLLERFVVVHGRLGWDDLAQSQRFGCSNNVEHLMRTRKLVLHNSEQLVDGKLTFSGVLFSLALTSAFSDWLNRATSFASRAISSDVFAASAGGSFSSKTSSILLSGLSAWELWMTVEASKSSRSKLETLWLSSDPVSDAREPRRLPPEIMPWMRSDFS